MIADVHDYNILNIIFGDYNMKIIDVNTGVYEKNDEIAKRVSDYFHNKGIKVL